MSKRLVKVAKELNVGTETIVEFLNGNGFSVINKPTAKISDEMYNALAKNFQNSIAIKEKANQITIGTRKAKEEQQKEKSKDLKTKEDEVTEPVITSVEPKTETPVVDNTPKVEEKKPQDDLKEKKEEVVEKKGPQLTGPKILGKINLDNQGKRGKKKKVEPKVEEKKALKEGDTTKEKKEVVKTSKNEQIKDTPKKEQKVEKVKEPVIEKEKTPVVVKEEKVSDQKVPENKTTEAEPVVLSNTTNPELDIKVDAPQLKGLKILGKINIASPKSKRKKKGKDNKRAGDSSDPKKKNLVASSESGQGQKKRRKRTRVRIRQLIKRRLKILPIKKITHPRMRRKKRSKSQMLFQALEEVRKRGNVRKLTTKRLTIS